MGVGRVNPDKYRQTVADLMSEAELQAKVTDLATRLGWLVFHDFDSRRSLAGFPDLVLTRGGWLIFSELKTSKGRLRPAQVQWMTRLALVASGASNVEAVVWRPLDLLAGVVEAALRTPPNLLLTSNP